MTFLTKLRILLREVGPPGLVRGARSHLAVLPYARGYHVSRCLQALEGCGVLDVLRAQGSFAVSELELRSRSPRCDPAAIEAVCDYLYAAGIFRKRGDRYVLGAKARLLCAYPHGVFEFIQAYDPIFHELPEILAGEKRYGVDVSRRDGHVAKATAEISQFFILPAVLHLLRKHGFRRVLDLGCGRGELLMRLASEPRLERLRGIDIAHESVKSGNERIASAGLAERIELSIGDISRPAAWSDALREADAVTLMYVLHEFLPRGEAFLVDLLRELRERAADGTAFLIAETPAQSPEAQRRKRVRWVAEHHLFHRLSNQGILRADQLRRVLVAAGLEIVEDVHFGSLCQHFVLARPRPHARH